MKYFVILFFLIYSISLYIEGTDSDRVYIMDRIRKKISNKVVLLNILVVILLNIYCYQYQRKNKPLIYALEKSNFAVIISICAYLDVVIVPFWIVFYISYFFTGLG